MKSVLIISLLSAIITSPDCEPDLSHHLVKQTNLSQLLLGMKVILEVCTHIFVNRISDQLLKSFLFPAKEVALLQLWEGFMLQSWMVFLFQIWVGFLFQSWKWFDVKSIMPDYVVWVFAGPRLEIKSIANGLPVDAPDSLWPCLKLIVGRLTTDSFTWYATNLFGIMFQLILSEK